VAGQNDSPKDAELLAQLVEGMNCHINLIPVNPIKEREFQRTDKESVQKFKYLLEKKQINVTIRRSVGRDIDAACGQLRLKYKEA
jgi:23S rRNA (adenine2503-C2)-methyltransferase